MSEFKVLAGFVIIAAVLLFWYRINRSLRGGGSGLDMTPQRRPRKGSKGADGANELERFVAQHRSGVLPSPPDGGGGSFLTAPSTLPPPAAAAATAPSAAALLHAPVLLTGPAPPAETPVSSATPLSFIEIEMKGARVRLPGDAPASIVTAAIRALRGRP